MTDKDIKVLIVEDHEATLKGLVAEISQTDGMRVVGAASNCQDGLRQLDEFCPDVVLLDLHLPDSEGPRSLAGSFCENSNSKIIVFSGDSRIAIRDLILKSGVSGYLLKSEPMANIMDAIRSVVSNDRQIVSAELTENSSDSKLTKAEEHLLMLIARGLKYKDIAKERFTAPETVRKQVDQILVKLDMESREELIAWAVENGYGTVDVERW